MSEDRETYGTEIAKRSDSGGALMVFDPDGANHLYKLAKTMSQSNLVPAHFRGKEADCFLAVEMAQRLRVAPFMVLQNLYVVHGTPAWKSQFLIAMANRSGTFKGSIMFKSYGEGDSLEVEAYATHADNGERIESRVSMAMAVAEGWTSNSKYKSMPEQMLRYRAATFLVRTYCPEVTMGLMTADEVETIPASEIEVSAPIIQDPEETLRVAIESANDAGVPESAITPDMDAPAIYALVREYKSKTETEEPEPAKEKPAEEPSPQTKIDAKKIALDTAQRIASTMDQAEFAKSIPDMVKGISATRKAAYKKATGVDLKADLQTQDMDKLRALFVLLITEDAIDGASFA